MTDCGRFSSDAQKACVPLAECWKLSGDVTRLREAARWLIDAYMGGVPLDDAINHLEAVVASAKQEVRDV